jgi:hypothetical protein
VFRVPQIGTELAVEVPYKQQEIISAADILTKFEGSATVTGTYQGRRVTGHAYGSAADGPHKNPTYKTALSGTRRHGC